MKRQALLLVGTLFVGAAHATVVDELLRGYEAAGASNFNPQRGARMWTETHIPSDGGKARSCTTCHTDDLKRTGRHVRTGKPVDPLAPSVNTDRLTDAREIEKWFRRNCKWVLGRVCTPQEKGDFLTFIRTQ